MTKHLRPVVPGTTVVNGARVAGTQGKPPFTMRQVLTAMIKAHEIQGVLAIENSFNRVGLDHVLLVRVASTLSFLKRKIL